MDKTYTGPTWAMLQKKRQEELEQKRKLYIERAIQSILLAKKQGVNVRVFGSLTSPSFRDVSDVDFVVLNEDSESAFKILEPCMGDIQIDVVELDSLKPSMKEKVLREMKNESDLLAYL